jgi:hypothetical protein
VARSSITGVNKVRATAALFLLTALSSSSSFAQISEEAMQDCAAIPTFVRRLTCYDLLAQLRVTERFETTGRGEGEMVRLHPELMIRLHPELMSTLDAWVEAQPEPKPSRPQAIRWLLDAARQSQKGSR